VRYHQSIVGSNPTPGATGHPSRCARAFGCLRMPTESIFLRKENREKLRKAEEKTGFSLARLINLLVEDGYLDELVAKRRKGNLRSAF